MSSDQREEGSDKGLSRRQLVSGAGLLVGGASALGGAGIGTIVQAATPPAASPSPLPAGTYYPPTLTGMRGSHPGSFEAAHAIRDGSALKEAPDIGERYDLVIVGAGMSGLASAYFMKKKSPNAKILVLDNHDDFGGHARRNETDVDGRTVIGYGGTMYILSPRAYTAEGRQLLADVGVDIKRFLASAGPRSVWRGLDTAFNLRRAVLFDKATFGVDKLVVGIPEGADRSDAKAWSVFLAKAPLSQRTKDDLLRLNTRPVDYLAGMSAAEKTALLKKTSYADYLTRYAKVNPQVITMMTKEIHSGVNGAAGIDTISALHAFERGLPGFAKIGIERPAPQSWISDSDGDDVHFPDGNHGLAKLLIRWLIPSALPGTTQEDSVLTRTDYSQLDRPEHDVRVRLSSTVGRVVHTGTPEKSTGVEVSYIRNGKAQMVRADAVVMACYNAIIPYIAPEVPAPQKEALHNAVRMPLVYGTAVVRNWQMLAKLGVGAVSCPGNTFWWDSIGLDWPSKIGGYQPAQTPSDPMPIHLSKVPTSPGLSAKDQFRAGRAELLATDIETIETATRDLFRTAFSSVGFDVDRDIVSITVNRHPHGYAACANSLYDPDWAPEDRPWVVGRKRVGRIAIANSDAGAICLTQAAFDQAHRAVNEIVTDVVQVLNEWPWGTRI